MEIVLDIALVGMGAGEACPCIAIWAESAAVLAAGAFDSIFFIFHYAVSFLFSNFFRLSIWHLAKTWKLSSRYVCPFSSISCMASFCYLYHSVWRTDLLLHTRKVTMDVGYLNLCSLRLSA